MLKVCVEVALEMLKSLPEDPVAKVCVAAVSVFSVPIPEVGTTHCESPRRNVVAEGVPVVCKLRGDNAFFTPPAASRDDRSIAGMFAATSAPHVESPCRNVVDDGEPVVRRLKIDSEFFTPPVTSLLERSTAGIPAQLESPRRNVVGV